MPTPPAQQKNPARYWLGLSSPIQSPKLFFWKSVWFPPPPPPSEGLSWLGVDGLARGCLKQ
jgi:hypothetical protein